MDLLIWALVEDELLHVYYEGWSEIFLSFFFCGVLNNQNFSTIIILDIQSRHRIRTIQLEMHRPNKLISYHKALASNPIIHRILQINLNINSRIWTSLNIKFTKLSTNKFKSRKTSSTSKTIIIFLTMINVNNTIITWIICTCWAT